MRKDRHRKSAPCLTLLSIALVAIGLRCAPISAEANKGTQALEQGRPVERELAAGQSHQYVLTLASNQYLHLIVEQLSVDVVVKVIGPGAGDLFEVDCPNNTRGPEPVHLLA